MKLESTRNELSLKRGKRHFFYGICSILLNCQEELESRRQCSHAVLLLEFNLNWQQKLKLQQSCGSIDVYGFVDMGRSNPVLFVFPECTIQLI